MSVNRVEIPTKVREKILNEYRHKCAKCGCERPQLHHIDEDPANNDEMNLIPLCPNCHQADQHDPHDPTRPINPALLALFRKYKDPTILKPQFQPLFRRMVLVQEPVDFSNEDQATPYANAVFELIKFVSALNMGSYYANELSEILPSGDVARLLTGVPTYTPVEDVPFRQRRAVGYKYRSALIRYKANPQQAVDDASTLIMELIRYQGW